MRSLSEKAKILFVIFLSVSYFRAFQNDVLSQTIKKIKPGVSSVAKIAAEPNREALKLLSLVNAERVKRGLNQLTWDDDVAKIAFAYCERMARENFFGHFDADGRDVSARARAANLKRWSKIGENLFSVERISDFDSFAVKNWMMSPMHRQNILNGGWTTTGIGVARAANGEIFITQVFIDR